MTVVRTRRRRLAAATASLTTGALLSVFPATPGFAQSGVTLPSLPTTTVPGTSPTTAATLPGTSAPTTSPSTVLPKVTVPTVPSTITIPGVPAAPSQTVPPAVAPHCLPEQYPAQNAPAGAPTTPYNIPVNAVINGGEFSVTGTKGGVLQLGPNYSMHISLCGLITLPSQTGAIDGNGPPPHTYGAPQNGYSDRFNNNMVFQNPIPVALELPGIPLPLMEGYGSANGAVNAKIELTPAANGGLNVDLYGSAKSTADFQGLPGILPPGPAECTVAIGDLEQDGLPPSDLASLGPPPAGSSYTGPQSLVHFTTGVSHFPGSQYGLTGQPVTGPITDGKSVAVSDDFPVAPISPDMPPVPSAPNAGQPPSTLCSPTVANALNNLIGLPSPPGNNWFSAPTNFAIDVCGETNPNPPHQPLVPACPIAPPNS